MGANPVGPAGISTFTQAHDAEIKAMAKSKGIAHNEATTFVMAGDVFPGARTVAMTHTAARSIGGQYAVPVAAFGPVAMAVTDSGYRAFSGSGSMSVHPPSGPGGGGDKAAAHGSTTDVWDFAAAPLTRGATRKNPGLFVDSIAPNEDAPTAAGISNVGGGPIAVATAGEAVAVSNADTLANEQGMA
ncbi:MAG: hypothetical protein J3K34DRAFT_409109 [Monoraphidium minutum]|nr:MAG: hypothetical protein J3K34DRAFT_409109 [Monoraphidium minutum]